MRLRALALLLPFVALLGACEPTAPTRARDPFGLVPPKPGPRSRARPLLPMDPPLSTPGPLISLPPPSATASAATLPEPPPHDEDDDAACPKEMVLVHGDYCPDARQDCAHWIDPDTPPFPRKRCGEFARPSRCASEKKSHLRFCIDKYEAAKDDGDVPTSDVSWTLAKEHCQSRGKRLCEEAEWIFACEGEEMLPYPTGFERPVGLCNFDREDLVVNGKMKDNRHAGRDHPQCVSPFGVVNMVGNIDEWTVRDGPNHHTPWRASLKGGWWLAGRNRCRPATTGHDEHYHDTQTGYRCCKDAEPD